MSDEYYQSEEWKEERGSALEDWDGECENCGCQTGSPHVHHTFGLGSGVYQILCPSCHAEHHGNPEIALFQKRETRCKYCDTPIVFAKVVDWFKSTDQIKWKAFSPGFTSFHRCISFKG